MLWTSPRQRTNTTIEITPLIDVVFLLLVFLILTMTTAQNQQNKSQEAIIDIQLARASQRHDDLPPQIPITLHLHESGKLFIDNQSQALALSDLALEISKKLAQNSQSPINLRADFRVSHGQVIEVLDLLKGLNIENVQLHIEHKGD